ncbi:MAG TPA: ATP-binding protein [Pseudonocardiaceae bacterium]
MVAEFDGRRLWLSVSDYSHDVPQIQPPNPGAACGRGLQLVDILSDRWGIERLRRTKTIWAVLTPD